MKSYRIALILTLCCVMSQAYAQKKQDMKIIDQSTLSEITDALKADSKQEQHARIDKGVAQAAAFWYASDGTADDFKNLCMIYNAKSGEERETIFKRLQTNFELLWGNYNKLSVGLKFPLHVEDGEILPIDRIFGGYSPGAHLNADFFENKLAFITILNFPFYTLAEKTALGTNWSRLEWAYARTGDVFKSRVPATVLQNFAQKASDADAYISDYNIYVGKLVDNHGKSYFPADMKLITHWGLRDEIKAQYAIENSEHAQAMIYEVMLRIIRQEIPVEVINNEQFTYNPYQNSLQKDGATYRYSMEPNNRYQQVINLFQALKEIDAYSPNSPTYIQRQFDEDMEIPLDDVEKIFTDLMSSPELKQIGKIIQKRLGRSLQPWDIWYDGFKTRSTLNMDQINLVLKEKYPNKESFENDLPNILVKFGFDPDSAKSITAHIAVDPSRGAGHAWGAAMRDDKARLRTRIGTDGMEYKGYNIAVHEFGHNVEQTISLHNVDYYMLNGVPNTSFTEALAFVFQARDLELLGMESENKQAEYLAAVDNLWSNYEIMGVSLVDIRVWKWLYANPDADAEALKKAVIAIATEVWNTYYAQVFGVKNSPILAVYSHMIDNPLYLSAYPIGQLIEFQFGSYIKDKDFADEIYRAFRQGRIIPQLWMKGAVGHEISAQPAIEAARIAIKALE